jgi:hypothetical protein
VVTTERYPAGVRRLGIVMAPNPADPYAAGGVGHPAEAHLYLLPRSLWRAWPCGGRGAAVRGQGDCAPPRSGLGPQEARR